MITTLILALAASPIALQDTSAGHARLHPEGALVYLEVPDVPAVRAAYGESAYGQLLADPGFQAALGALLGQETVDPLAELARLYEGAVESGDLPPLADLLLAPLRRASFSLSLKEGRIDAVVAAVRRSGREGASPPAVLHDQLGLELALDFDGEDSATAWVDFAASFVDGQGGSSARESAELSPGGSAVTTRLDLGVPGLRDVHLVRDGARVVLLAGMHTGAALHRRLSGESAGLAEAAGLTLGREHFGPSTGTVVAEGYSLLGDQLLGLAELPATGPAIEVLEGLFGPTISMIARGGHWRVQLVGGRFVTDGFHAAAVGGPFERLFSNGALGPEAFGLVHPEAIVGWVVHLDREALLEGLSASAGAEDLEAVEREYGFRPDRDLVAPLGPAVAYSLPPVRSILAAPPFMLAVALDDEAAFRRGLEGVCALLEGEFQDSLTLTRDEYRGVTMYTIEFIGGDSIDLGFLPIDPVGFFKPTIVILPDRVFVTTLASHAKREIRRVLKGADERAALLDPASIPAGVSEAGFADWVSFVGKLYDGLVPLASLAPAEVIGALPIDLANLPKSDVFTGFFDPSTHWKRSVGGGVLHHCESSFGPELPFALVLVAGGASMAAVSGFEAPPPPSGPDAPEVVVTPPDAPAEPPADPRERTAETLAAVDVAITVYTLEKNSPPARLADLLEPTPSYPRGFLKGAAELPTDGWDRALRYSLDDARWRLWSLGPDGVDQGGEGDDILVR